MVGDAQLVFPTVGPSPVLLNKCVDREKRLLWAALRFVVWSNFDKAIGRRWFSSSSSSREKTGMKQWPVRFSFFFYPRKSEGSVGYCTSSTRHEMARGAAIPRRINTYKRRGAASLNAGEGGFFAFPRPFSPQRRRRWIKELGEEGKKTHMDSDVKEQYSQIEWSLAGIYVTRYTRAVLKTDAPFN